MPMLLRRHRLAWAALAALLAASPAALAQDPDVKLTIRLSKDFKRCMDSSRGVTPAMIECDIREKARWDDRLNVAYRAIMANRDYSERAKEQMRDAQRAWIAFRDKACVAAGDITAEGGSMSRIVAAECLLRMTAQRAADLEMLTAREP